MGLEYVDINCGRIYFIRGVHPASLFQHRKKAALRSYLKNKKAIEEALKYSSGLASECAIEIDDIKDYDSEIQKYSKAYLDLEYLDDYFILKCIKMNKDYYVCDVFQSASKIRALATLILPYIIQAELATIAAPIGLANFFYSIWIFGAGTILGKDFVKPAKWSTKIARSVRYLITPLLVMLDKFREITTAIQLKAILERNKKEFGKNDAITYMSHGGHTDSIMNYVKMPMPQLEKELFKLLKIQDVYKIYFRHPIEIPISLWSDKDKERMLIEAQKRGFNLEQI